MATDRLFDPSQILNANLGANATKFDPHPIGECLAHVVELKMTDGKAGPRAKNPGAPWYRLDVKLETTDPEYLKLYPAGDTREKAVFFDGIMLDMENGEIAQGPNRNINLGKFREACKANGQPLNAVVGQYVRVAIAQKPHPDETKAAQGVILNEIAGYTPA